MPRPPKFSDDDVLDAARECLVEHGRAFSMAEVATALGGPVGSIYHRFASRDVLVARLWMRSIRRFQAGLFELAEEGGDPHDLLVAMAVHVPKFCRSNRAEALALTLHRHERLAALAPVGLEKEIAAVNERIEVVMRDLTEARYGFVTPERRRLVLLATRVGPYGLVRPWLGSPIPTTVDDAVAASADAILRLGE